MALLCACQTRQLPGVGEIGNPARHARRSPPVGLEEMFDLPLDVEAPHGLIRTETQRLERNLDFRGPPLVRLSDCRIPDSVPVAAEALGVVRDLAVGARARGVDLKKEAVAMIEERIEHDRDLIID